MSPTSVVCPGHGRSNSSGFLTKPPLVFDTFGSVVFLFGRVKPPTHWVCGVPFYDFVLSGGKVKPLPFFRTHSWDGFSTRSAVPSGGRSGPPGAPAPCPAPGAPRRGRARRQCPRPAEAPRSRGGGGGPRQRDPSTDLHFHLVLKRQS